MESQTHTRTFLERLFRTATAAAHPSTCLQSHLPPPPSGKLIVLAAGKAAGSMIEETERFYVQQNRLRSFNLIGIAVARHGSGRP
ncbi:MAG: DUF4147 domain-containing protein, partial [Xanthobacteraceae bacterium]